MRNKLAEKYFISACDLLQTKHVPLWDFHIHTNFTDGKASVKQVFEKAVEKKLETIIFTEHTESWRVTNKNWFQEYCLQIEENQKCYHSQINAFIGLEANALNFLGNVELNAEMQEKANFILGAAHRYPTLGTRKVSKLSAIEAIDLEYKTLMGLAQSVEIDAIAHIGATCSKYCTPFPNSLVKEIIKEAVKNHIAIEINPVYHKPLLQFIELCASENAQITLGSNAHGFNDIGFVVKELENCFIK